MIAKLWAMTVTAPNTECGLLCSGKFHIARVASHVGSQASKYFYVYESICTVIR